MRGGQDEDRAGGTTGRNDTPVDDASTNGDRDDTPVDASEAVPVTGGVGTAGSLFDERSPTATTPLDVPPPPGPTLPFGQAKAPPPMVDPIAQPRPGAATWYRTDEERSKSVYRRANPWYRRAARGVIGLAFLAVAGLGLYAGARALQDYLDRDQLPAPGAEIPEIRATSFIVTSEAPAPTLDGTLTIDTDTGAFEYVGRAGGPQSGLQIVSADGSTAFVRQGTAPWRASSDTDGVVNDVRIAVGYLVDADTADDILTNRLRRGFVELLSEAEEGTGADRLTRYEMTFDTRGFAEDFPLQWQAFRDDAVPGAQEDPEVPVTIWLDTEDVLMRVTDGAANWAWERLAYADQPFRPADPADDAGTQVVQVACVSDDNTIFWQTPFPSCDLAMTAARSAAADAGVADAFDDLDRTIARVCSTMEREDGTVPASPDEASLATALVEASVCRGDPADLTAG